MNIMQKFAFPSAVGASVFPREDNLPAESYSALASAQTLNWKYRPCVYDDTQEIKTPVCLNSAQKAIMRAPAAAAAAASDEMAKHKSGCRLAVRALEQKRFSSLAPAADCIYPFAFSLHSHELAKSG
jgi:hypothetical protein